MAKENCITGSAVNRAILSNEFSVEIVEKECNSFYDIEATIPYYYLN